MERHKNKVKNVSFTIQFSSENKFITKVWKKTPVFQSLCIKGIHFYQKINLNIEYTIFNLKKYWPKLLLEKFNMRIYTCAYICTHN